VTLGVHSPYWQSTLWLLLVGIGSGMFNSPNTAAMMGTVPPGRVHTALWVLAGTCLVGATVSLMRPAHEREDA
jgi:uncharacterized membrane protein YhaH (DUF805 family)